MTMKKTLELNAIILNKIIWATFIGNLHIQDLSGTISFLKGVLHIHTNGSIMFFNWSSNGTTVNTM